MKKIDGADPIAQSADIVGENIAQLKAIFPEAFAEGKVDFDKLKQLLGGAVDEREEKYGLSWNGKRRARQIALTPSAGTLRPKQEESINWDKTKNIIIEGDNLEVLKLMQRSYAGDVKLVYIDPPYNTGSDFVYPDDYSDNIRNYLEYSGQVVEGVKQTSQLETTGRFHTRWLNMMYPRLKLAKNLLSDSGLICISIDDGEIANLRGLCDEIFGEENHVATIVWQKRYVSNVTAKWLSDMHDYIVIYARNKDAVKIRSWERTQEQLEAYKNPDEDARGVWRAQDLSASKPYAAGLFTITGPTGLQFDPPPNRYWRCNKEQFDRWEADNRIWWGVNKNARPMLKAFLEETERGITPNTWWDYNFAGHNKEATLELKKLFDGDAPFDTPKPIKLLQRLLQLFCQGNETVLDFFCGSGTLGHAVLKQNLEESTALRYIMVQLPESLDRKDFATLSGVVRARMTLAAKAIQSENPLFSGDLGYRSFRLDSSNIRAWDPIRDNIADSLDQAAQHLKADRSEQDILFELLLKLGLDLTVPIEAKTVANKTVHSIGAGVLIACLADTIGAKEVEPLALGIADWHEKLAPAGETQIVFRDSAFADDVAKTNLTAILQQHGLATVRSL
ncbi:site-specific DNA-methyltransferase [Rhodopseudomonas sp. P1]|uniref:site-specific DNA-methyltransferase n=1 Tax=Rhodopseudomonas sp. P1 TaxID=3434357 RepID=UPI0031FBF1BB